MFFVFGSPRSGTTLLAQNLTAHSRIEIPYETDFIVPAAFIFDRIKDPATGRPLLHGLLTASTAYKGGLGPYLDAGQLREIVDSADYNLPGLLNSIYARIAAKAGKQLAGDKSPNDLQYIRIIMKQLREHQDIKFLHIVRDLRDVMVSIKQRGWTRDTDSYFPRMWSTVNLYLHELMRDTPERYLLLRYEDLVRDPEQAFDAACSFLGMDFEPAMLGHEQRARRFGHMPHHQRLFQAIDGERVGIYRHELTADAVLRYEQQADEALRVFGYQGDA